MYLFVFRKIWQCRTGMKVILESGVIAWCGMVRDGCLTHGTVMFDMNGYP